ncbi:MAG: hypothetical protein M1828_003308 [Chrysothrix sp. TS-e1954]|nr:MAG: hypothetical protein M1828_003308 [Chrysothrix sp. TS-e1954]
MAEVQPRTSAPRGRGSHRTGRGGFTSRGGGRTASKQANGESGTATADVPLEEQGELGLLKMQYSSELSTLREFFPDWTDEDLVYALQETDGDLQSTTERITEGSISRFADVKKKTREKSRTKSTTAAPLDTEKPSTSTRGRGRGEGRGGRTRGTSDRGGRPTRGARGGTSSSAPRSHAAAAAQTAAAESSGWGDPITTSQDAAPAHADAVGSWDQPGSAANEATTGDSWADSVQNEANAGDAHKSSLIPQGSTKSWASMLAKPKTTPAMPQGQIAPPHAKETGPLSNTIAPTEESELAHETTPRMSNAEALGTGINSQTPSGQYGPNSDSGVNLTPPKDSLTEDNVEQLPDATMLQQTETVASTRDPSSAVNSVTPSYSRGQQPPISRPPLGGYQTSAWKATGMPGRSASYQRKMAEQQEAVVMPGNHAVDRAAVQFGSMGISGDQGGNSFDVDEDREDTETRAQPPQQSPSAPRASLPQMAMSQQPPQEILPPENTPTPKQAPGLPHPSQNAQNMQQQQPATGPSAGAPGQNYAYGRYGAGLGHEQASHAQKPYDPYGQQSNYPSAQQDHQNMYPSHSQAPSQLPSTARSHIGGFSQDQNEYASHYPEQQRNAYQQYYASSYGQQGGNSLQENVPPVRSGSGFGPGESNYGGGAGAQAQGRFSEAQNSGQNTPNPTAGPQHHVGAQSQHMPHQQAGHGGHGGGYASYNNPYSYNSQYSNYMNQYPNHQYYGQGYGGGYGGGKNNMYNQYHPGFGMNPQAYNEHSSSPANAGSYNASTHQQNRDSGYGAGPGEFGRSGSAQAASQASQQHATGAGGFGGMNDSFARSASGNYGSHTQQQYGHPSSGATDDSLKAFHETKNGPSPSLSQQGRPSSTINTAHQQGSQPGYGGQQHGSYGTGYPNSMGQLHNNHGSQYGSLGGLGGGHQGGAQGHQSGAYGNYGGFGNNYGSYQRGGWGGNYPGHQ